MKVKTKYVCQSCGSESPKWLGRCNQCGEWSSFVEEKNYGDKRSHSPLPTLNHANATPWVLIEDRTHAPTTARRITTGMAELDRVLGGGMVSDGFVLLGGDPGIGKSTLLLQMAKQLTEANAASKVKILYASGEESVEQIRMRAERIGVNSKEQIYLTNATTLEDLLASVQEIKPQVLVVDSLQTFSSRELESPPGTVSQVREIAHRLMQLAKGSHLAIWLVGHVTKEGNIAGPKVVEHMVDTVLYFEGDQNQHYRLLRAQKNRFGNCRELGVFEMTTDGLREVSNPSELFLTPQREAVPGSTVCCALEGTRPLFVEVQALVSHSSLTIPRRTTVGIESNRVALLAAILERHLRLPLAQKDLFFNVVGGFRLQEPATDLAAVAAIWSSLEDIAIPIKTVFIGEVGLTGEVRSVSHIDTRIHEAKKLGFETVVTAKGMKPSDLEILKKSGLRLVEIQKVKELPGIFS